VVGGLLYGTTYQGGSAGGGVVFSVTPDTGKETVLHDFVSSSDGAQPPGTLAYYNGTFYGTTQGGGSLGGSGFGTVFSYTISSGTESVLHTFTDDTTKGISPAAGVIYSGGALYGTTEFGGAYNDGTVFKLVP
jgi:uncharacterized repeat protein (TIGR03803 family)